MQEEAVEYIRTKHKQINKSRQDRYVFLLHHSGAIVKGIEAASDLLVMSERPADARICLIKSF